ncbi:MAG: spore protease YyaC [Bacillota bacterium]|nr:spore protease YyaC [Bacillota bacterium]
MILFRKHYQENNFLNQLINVLENELSGVDYSPVILCIGSDRHLQDCFGPLTGTMLSAVVPTATLMGTLDEPIHAKNLIRQLAMIEELGKTRRIIALDAALGNPEDIGVIQLKKGSLLPGKALGRRLPPVGDYALTGIVGSKIMGTEDKRFNSHSLGPVYHMANMISQSLAVWLSLEDDNKWFYE